MNRTLRLIRNLLVLSVGASILVLIAFQPGWAANHYVRAAASGTANGSDWTNACTDFTGSCAVASLVRGDTYYVGTGTYAHLILNTANSGASVITIKGATATDHGTDTGWSAAYGVDVTQAAFNWATDSSVKIQTDYWTFDGNVGSGGSSSSYGFLLKKPSDCNTADQFYLYVRQSGGASSSQTAIVVKHIAVNACGVAFDVGQAAVSLGCAACYLTNSTMANSFFDGAQNTWSTTNVANSTYEYNWSQNQWSSSAHHGEGMSITNCHASDSGGCSTACTQGQCAYNNTYRYNVMKNCRGTACIAALSGNVKAMNAWKIYGNVFVDGTAGNGVIATGSSATNVITDTVIYNNTFVDCPSQIFWQCGSATPCASASGNVFRNNLFYNSSSALNAGTGGTITHDYNSFLSAISTPPAETNGQTGSFDPFVNRVGGNYYLANNTSVNAGVSLGAPYNTDVSGRTRGADGKWDRGAFEFNLSPAAPQNLRVVP